MDIDSYSFHCGVIDCFNEMVAAGVEHWSSCQGMNDIQSLVHRFGDRMTFFGCMDTPAVQDRSLTQEEINEMTAARIDDICRGGCVFPLGNSTTRGLSEAVQRALAERDDFFEKEENRRLP